MQYTKFGFFIFSFVINIFSSTIQSNKFMFKQHQIEFFVNQIFADDEYTAYASWRNAKVFAKTCECLKICKNDLNLLKKISFVTGLYMKTLVSKDPSKEKKIIEKIRVCQPQQVMTVAKMIAVNLNEYGINIDKLSDNSYLAYILMELKQFPGIFS